MTKTFQQFLTEAPQQFSRADFPKSLANIKEAGRRGTEYKHFDRMIEMLNQALRDGGMPNVDYQRLKSLVNNFIEMALSKPERIYDAVFGGVQGFTLYDINSSLVYANQVAGKLKKAEQFAKTAQGPNKIYVDWYLPIIRELAPMAAAVTDLKGKAVKRVVKTDAEKAAAKTATYQGTLASQQTVKELHDVLKTMTDTLLPKLIAYRADVYQTEYETIATAAKRDPAKFYVLMVAHPSRMGPNATEMLAQRHHTARVLAGVKARVETRPGETARIKTTGDVASIIHARAEREAHEVQQVFLQKNVAKLAAILERKGALKGHPKASDLHYGHGIFQGDVRVEFADGSGFTVRNKIVFKAREKRGWVTGGYTYFVQFPTTFHDAVLPSGTRMPGQPSERDMVHVFPQG